MLFFGEIDLYGGIDFSNDQAKTLFAKHALNTTIRVLLLEKHAQAS